ncbi:MAG: hypothetical protein EPN48_08075 [Microbacteriaceae bacterium]|nr:MAG: hypothetical protein EPN48_08075 [Microbacteriaceae bacterium]
MTTEALTPATRWSSIVTAWLLAVIAVVCIGLFSPREQYFTWLSLSLGGAVVAALAIQLGTRQKNGFVERLIASVFGVLVVLAVGAVVLWVVRLTA